MKKVFIAQPMTGFTEEEIAKERNKAILEIDKLMGDEIYTILDQRYVDKLAPEDAEPAWVLAEDLKILSTADLVYFCEGWKQSKGCRVEHMYARMYDINIIKA